MDRQAAVERADGAGWNGRGGERRKRRFLCAVFLQETKGLCQDAGTTRRQNKPHCFSQADRAPFNLTIVDWMAADALVVSSMAMSAEREQREGAKGGGVIVHRAVCLAQGSELSAVEADGSVTLSCGADARMRRVLPRSRVLNLAQPTSPMGAWVLQRAPAVARG
jgi:hypothetical protein